MVYMFVYSPMWGEREEVKKQIGLIEEIKHWRFDLPNSFYLDSELDESELAKKIHSINPEARFMLIRLRREETKGWLPRETWDFIKEYDPIGDKD